LLIKYIKSVLWREAKRLSYVEDARCLKVNEHSTNTYTMSTRLCSFTRSSVLHVTYAYRGADKSLDRPGRKQVTATKL